MSHRIPKPPWLPEEWKCGVMHTKDRQNARKSFSTGKHCLKQLTVDICQTFARRSSLFCYDRSKNIRRILTYPYEPTAENEWDNLNNNLILCVGDIIGSEEVGQYYVMNILGVGTFGQVFKCRDMATDRLVGVKVIKNITSFSKQSIMEIEILNYLKVARDPHDKHHIVRLQNSFKYKNHVCIVFELLSINLYEFMKKDNHTGLAMNTVAYMAQQLLDALCVLKSARVIHADLKPENILLKRLNSNELKVIDFGSSFYEKERLHAYIQSRFYRSPEVLLGLKYTTAMDMWSFGCIIAELYLGTPLFPGQSEYNQIELIINTIGLPPESMIKKGKKGRIYFNHHNGAYTLKSVDEYCISINDTKEKLVQRYHRTKLLEKLILMCGRDIKNDQDERQNDDMLGKIFLLDFLEKSLTIDPDQRHTPEQALKHPFIKRYSMPQTCTQLNCKETNTEGCSLSLSDRLRDSPDRLYPIVDMDRKQENQMSNKKRTLKICCSPPISPVADTNNEEFTFGVSSAVDLPLKTSGKQKIHHKSMHSPSSSTFFF
ncbi:kinase-like domain-containing protein [Spinellus fusiger]|nr:kinase-like domain-containing protein [Spinellus fusiger]